MLEAIQLMFSGYIVYKMVIKNYKELCPWWLIEKLSAHKTRDSFIFQNFKSGFTCIWAFRYTITSKLHNDCL